MASQLAMAETTLNASTASTSLRVPLISSQQVVTCDNTNFSPKDPDDRHRLGVVVSVPFFDGKQKLAGLVSGVVRSEVLAGYLPDGDGAVILPATGYTMGQFDRSMQASHSRRFIEEGRPDPDLVYSEVVPLDILDLRGKWYYWAGRPNSEFLESQSSRSATKVACFQFTILVVSLTVVLAGFYGIQRKRQLVTERAALLDAKVKESVSIITAQQEQMAASARLAGLGEMAAGIAHEINNPLAIIRGNAERLVKRFNDRELQMDKIEGHLTTITQTVDRIVSIIRGLQAISRDGKGDPFVPTSVKSVIDESIDLCSARFQRAGVNLTKSVPENAPSIDCRPAQVAQVIVNLLNNAFDAVSGSNGAWVAIAVHGMDSGSHIRISVTDSGKGIPPEVLKRLMTPFFTTKPSGKGTGLGLSVSHGIAESHRGKLWVDTACLNTRFVLELPIRQDGSARERRAA